MTHRLNLLLLFLALLVGLPYYWLLLENPSRDVAPYALTMARLRQLGAALPGPAPTAVGMRVVGWDRSPGNLLAAGAGMKRKLYTIMSFRLDVPGRGPIVIDTGTTGQLVTREHAEAFEAVRQARLDADLRQAGLIIPTGDGPLILGGLARLAGTDGSAYALSLARLNPAQVPSATRGAGLPWPEQFSLGPAIVPGRPQAVAPGVVVIPTGAPKPGSQMAYVRLADGREFLFAGPVAPYAVNAAELRTSSRAYNLFYRPEDRAGAMRWLVTLRQLHRQAPQMKIVPGHDVMALNEPEEPLTIPELR